MRRTCLQIIGILFFTFAFLPLDTFAQSNSSGFAQLVPIEEELQNGDIICTYLDGIGRCTQEYDSAIFGVYTENPTIVIEDPDIQNGKAILRDGITQVRVSGPIAEGDFITTSENAGIGKKAVENGYVVGIALDTIESEEPTEIQMLINIHPATTAAGSRGNLLQFIRKGISVPVYQPLESFRYLLAILIIIISFTLGLIYFGRASRSGIEAIGRNPLAKRVIQLTVMLNIVLTLVIVLVGLAIAYLILIL